MQKLLRIFIELVYVIEAIFADGISMDMSIEMLYK